MTTVRYSAWRFVHPSFEAQKGQSGLRVSTKGGIEMVHEHASVRQAILLLLSTKHGERVMRPDYGCDLNQLVFMLNDITTHGLAIRYVRLALERWEPRIDILFLDVDADEYNPAAMDITIEYRVRSTQRTDRLLLSYNLRGTED